MELKYNCYFLGTMYASLYDESARPFQTQVYLETSR
jgi:hypothetical protein